MVEDLTKLLPKRPFEFSCSTLPFCAEAYSILARQGDRLNALLRGTVSPCSDSEDYFVRCIRDSVDYDSHQSIEADAWRRLLERREFEKQHQRPSPRRTWIREWELRGGMILFPTDRSSVLLATPNPETQIQRTVVKYRNRPDLPWHSGRLEEGGRWWLVTSLKTRKQSELFLPKSEILQAADGMNRVMTFLWWNGPDEDMLVQDPGTKEVFFIPPDRVSWDFLSVPFNADSQVRTQWWDDKPVWAWGAA